MRTGAKRTATAAGFAVAWVGSAFVSGLAAWGGGERSPEGTFYTMLLFGAPFAAVAACAGLACYAVLRTHGRATRRAAVICGAVLGAVVGAPPREPVYLAGMSAVGALAGLAFWSTLHDAQSPDGGTDVTG